MGTSPLDSPVENRQPLREAVYQRLRKAIVEGHLKPGERLVETRIAERLHVSRLPVREAFRRLEQENLVRASSQGMVVTEITATKVEETYAIRAVLEGLCCRLAAQQITPQEAERLRASVDRTHQAIEGGDLEAITAATEEFHELLLEISRNATLKNLLSQVRDSVLRYRYATIPLEGRASELLREHRMIADAILAHDAERAEQLARQHILAAGRRLVASLR